MEIKNLKILLKNYIKNIPGDILNEENKVIGKHNGMFYTTIGQREGIGNWWLKKIQKIYLGMYTKKIFKIMSFSFAKEIQIHFYFKKNIY